MGYSHKGRLGCIPKEECDKKVTISSPREIKELSGIQITNLVLSNFHSFAVTSKGKIFGWGENKNFVFGSELKDADKHTKSDVYYFPVELSMNKHITRAAVNTDDIFKTYFLSSYNLKQNYKISQKFKIKKIACGGTHTLGLTSSGDVLSWGYGAAGQLGHEDIDILPNPTLLDFKTDAKIDKIYAGRNHSMAITSISHQVYTWGEGSYGQLGFNMKKCFVPTIIESLIGKSAVKGCLGIDNSAVITKSGDVYVWGSNTFNKLGLTSKSLNEVIPVLNSNLKNIKSISFGFEHSGVVDTSGNIKMWGNNLCGQLGLSHFNNVEIPTSLDFKETFLKVKCGSYQTLFLDTKKQVYTSGKGQLNLETEIEIHKPYPYIIEEFKGDKKAEKIQVGFGNSLILTGQKDVYGFGANEHSKAGGELNDEYVMKNPRHLHFETNLVKRSAILNIFAAYDHCFALTSFGEIFAWGNPRLFRLSGGFGDKVSRHPKVINIEWLHKGVKDSGNQSEEDEEWDSNIDVLDERQILTILNKNMRILSFKDLVSFMKKLGSKYDENEIVKKDELINNEIKIYLNKLSTEFTVDLETLKALYMEIDALTSIRIKEIRPPKFEGWSLINNMPKEILMYTDEIEKIYSLIFIHPCLMRTLLSHTKAEEQEIFMDGILPVYREMDFKLKLSENFITINFISFFRLCIDIDYLNYKSDLDLFCVYQQKTLIEIQLKALIYNCFNKFMIIEIAEQSMIELKNHIFTAKQLNTPKVLEKYRNLFNNNYEKNQYFEFAGLKDIFNLVEFFIQDLENNYHKFSDTFLYCMNNMKKHIKKDQLNSVKDKKYVKFKLTSLMMRFFFSNIIGRSIANMHKDENNMLFVCQAMNVDSNSTFRILVESYLNIIGEILERIACNEKYIYKETEKEEEDEEEGNEEAGNIKSTITFINGKIQDLNSQLFVTFLNKFPKSKFPFKKHVISSLVYNNLSLKPHKMIIELDKLIKFLKFLGERKNIFAGEMNFEIFSAIKHYDESKILTKISRNKKIKFSIDAKYLISPLDYALKYEKEVETNAKLIEVTLKSMTFSKCIKCSIVLPSVFLKPEMRSVSFVKEYKRKVKQKEYLTFCKIILHRHFVTHKIKTLTDIMNSIKKMRKSLEDNFCTDVNEYQDLNCFEDFVMDLNNQNKSEEAKMIDFVSEIHSLLRKKIHHVYKTNENQKILQDISDASVQIRDYLDNLIKSLLRSKGHLKLFTNSIEIMESNKAELEAKLKHKILNKPVYTNDNIFKFKSLMYTIPFLKRNMILLSYDRLSVKEENVYLFITANFEKKYFDLKFKNKKNNE